MTIQEKLKQVKLTKLVRVIIRDKNKLEKWFRENKYEMKVDSVIWSPSMDTPEEYRLIWVENMWRMLGWVVENKTFKQKGITIYRVIYGVKYYDFLEDWTELVPESKVLR